MNNVEIKQTKHCYEVIKKFETKIIDDQKEYKLFIKNVERLKKMNEKIQKELERLEYLMENKCKITAVLDNIMAE